MSLLKFCGVLLLSTVVGVILYFIERDLGRPSLATETWSRWWLPGSGYMAGLIAGAGWVRFIWRRT